MVYGRVNEHNKGNADKVGPRVSSQGARFGLLAQTIFKSVANLRQAWL